MRRIRDILLLAHTARFGDRQIARTASRCLAEPLDWSLSDAKRRDFTVAWFLVVPGQLFLGIVMPGVRIGLSVSLTDPSGN